MTRLPELRDALLDAGRREHDSPPADDPPTTAASAGRRRHTTARRRGRHTSLLAAALAGLLVLAAAGFAATRLIQSGTPITPPAGFSPTPRAGFGMLSPGSARLLQITAADPAGGPPWGMRVLRTTRGLGCVQVGRLVDGEIGALGQDGAFADDGRFHALPATAISTGTMCEPLDAAGQTFVAVSSHGAAASGVVQDCQKAPIRLPANLPADVRARLRRLGPTPICPPEDLRTLYYGLLGPKASSLTYRSPGGQLVTTPTVGPDGAYLVVLPGTGPHTPPTSYSTVGASPASGIVSVQYTGGARCVIPPANRLGGATPCPTVGAVPVHSGQVSSQQVATPIHASLTKSPKGAWTLHLRFIARVAVTSIRSSYDDLVVVPRTSACGGIMLGGGTSIDARAGQVLNLEMPIPGACHRTLTGRVTYVRTSGLSRLPPPLGDGPLVGRFAITVP
ncbi:MAG TPA: hypothetical protein VIJ51_08915 [Solirubrobacteraceae bacterium]